MRTRTGGVVAICLVVVTVLVVLFTNSESVILNSESPPGEPKTTTVSEGFSVSVSDMLWHIIIEKWFETPEKYVELTEEEVARFSALQAALQTLEGSNQTDVWYKTSEGETKRIDSYLTTKIGDKYNCKVCGEHFFKYRGEFYHFYIVVVWERQTTENLFQTTTVSEGLSASGAAVFLCVILGSCIYRVGRRKRSMTDMT